MGQRISSGDPDGIRTMSVQVVISSDNMDDETFQKHMSARHKESLGGMTELSSLPSNLVALYRRFHRKLHELRPELLHDHGKYRRSS